RRRRAACARAVPREPRTTIARIALRSAALVASTMMRRRPDSSSETTSAAFEALVRSPALESRWVAHVRTRLGIGDADAPGARSDEKMRWTAVFVAFLEYIF